MNVRLHQTLPENASHPLKAWMQTLAREGSQHWVENVDTDIQFLEVGEWWLPISISQNDWDSSYVTSPYTGYVTYAIEELAELKSPVLEAVLATVLRSLGVFMKRVKFNDVIMVNNWLVSTNLYPKKWCGEHLDELTKLLQDQYPKHAIIFRSLTPYLHETALDAFPKKGYTLIPSRIVYFVDSKIRPYRSLKDNRRDRSLLAKTPYIRVTENFSKDDINRIFDLYGILYLRKHSKNNPAFSKSLIEFWVQSKTLYFEGLRNPTTGQLDGIIGCFEFDGCLTTPLLGFDTEKPKQSGLYRMLCQMILQRAESKNHTLHRSSGAAQFKQNRGALPYIEYSAVMTQHLPFSKRLIWNGLAFLLNKVGLPLAKRIKIL